MSLIIQEIVNKLKCQSSSYDVNYENVSLDATRTLDDIDYNHTYGIGIKKDFKNFALIIQLYILCLNVS